MDDELKKLLSEVDSFLEESDKNDIEREQQELIRMENSEKRRRMVEKYNASLDIVHNEENIISNLQEEFKRKTKLNKVDTTFLGLATALQVLRWWFISNDIGRLSNDQVPKKGIKKLPEKPQKLFSPVPYDAFRTGGLIDTGLSGKNHRVMALAHEPLIGWIVGPTNIITDTVTKNEFPVYPTYRTELLKGHYTIMPTLPVPFPVVFGEGIAKSVDDPLNLIMAVIRHALHLGTDAFTKYGLPVPVINEINPELTLLLQQKGQIDLYSVSRGYVLSWLIDLIISTIHSLFYKKESGLTEKQYLVKTKKIVLYSNVASSSANILTVGGSVAVGHPEMLKKLNVGGLLKTLNVIITHPKFISNMEREFVVGEFSKMLLAEEEEE